MEKVILAFLSLVEVSHASVYLTLVIGTHFSDFLQSPNC